MQRHSDHRANPTRNDEALRHFWQPPKSPRRSRSMIPLAHAPPLWFMFMNPRVVAHFRGDMSKADIKPSIRDEIVAHYSPSTKV